MEEWKKLSIKRYRRDTKGMDKDQLIKYEKGFRCGDYTQDIIKTK